MFKKKTYLLLSQKLILENNKGNERELSTDSGGPKSNKHINLWMFV